MKSLLIIALLLQAGLALCDEKKIEYVAPGKLDFLTNIPSTLKMSWNDSFNTKPATLWTWSAIAASSIVFYIYDEKIYHQAQKLGRTLHLDHEDHTRSYISIGGKNVMEGPSDSGSAIYFIGNGWTQFGIASAFLINGKFSDDNRAMQTGSQIINALLSGSIPTQIIKRLTGRQDPYRASQYRGKWEPFNKNYDNDISGHDAVPSGHLMAATATFTVIDNNYPEYRHIIRPVGFTLLTLLSFQMLNTGVHWISDYPLGAAIGYVVGKAATRHGIKKADGTVTSQWNITPMLYAAHKNERTYGMLAQLDF